MGYLLSRADRSSWAPVHVNATIIGQSDRTDLTFRC